MRVPISLAGGAMLLAAGIAALVAPLLLDHQGRLWLAGLVATGAVGINALIWRADRQRGVMAAFPCMALAAAALGVGWTLGLL